MCKKIKIAFFISNLGQGGAEKQYITLIKELNPSIFEKHVFLYAYQKETFFPEIFEFIDTTIHTNRLKSKLSLLKILEAGRYIRREIKNEQFDLVVSTLFMNNFLVRFFAPNKYKNRFIANIRTSIDAYGKWHKWAEMLQINSSYLVFNSQIALNGFKQIIPQKYHYRLQLIYNGFRIPDFIAPNTSVNFGCLGRLSYEKNFLQVVKVFHLYEKINIRAKLVIQGYPGNQYNQIVASITSYNIRLLHQDPDIEKFFQTIRVLIIPSLFEGCPNVLFEAFLRKRICIISKGANSDDFIIDGINGFVYDGSDKDLLDTLVRVSNIFGTEVENQIIKNGYNYAHENFSIKTMTDQYEQLFLKIHEANN